MGSGAKWRKRWKVEGNWGERCGNACKIFYQSAFRYTRSWYTLWLVDFDSFCQQWSVFDHSEKCDMAVTTDSTSRPEFELAINTALSDFPNVEAKREEQRNCLKQVVGRIDVFAISPTGFGKSLIFQLCPRIKRTLEGRQDRMPVTIVVVTPLITIMDQVEYLNKSDRSSGGNDGRRCGWSR